MTTSEIGRRVGRFELLAQLGSGGFARVYRAEDTRLGRQVALKVLHGHLAEDAGFVRRFDAEARAAARLRHPNVVTVYEVGETEDGRPYLVMELLSGLLLSSVLATEGPLPLERAAAILAQLASALDYLHDEGLVYRDVKPANIMIGAGDHVTLMDFGIARALEDHSALTSTGFTVGTPTYMAPEQITASGAGPAADLYALGIVAYELLAGRPPFTGSATGITHDHVYTAPPPIAQFNPDVPAGAAAAIARALAKDPQERPGGAMAFVQALGAETPAAPAAVARMAPAPAALGSVEPTLLVPNAAADEGRTSRRSRRRATYLLLPVVLLGLAGLVLLSRHSRRAATPASPAALPATARTGAAALPPQLLHVVADDDAAKAKVPEAQQALGAVLPQVLSGTGLAPSQPLTVHLAATSAALGTRLTADFAATPSDVAAFVRNKRRSETRRTGAGVESVLYLPNVVNLRAELGTAAAAYVLQANAGADLGARYPFWFWTGFESFAYEQFAGGQDDLRRRAAADVKAGLAPPLAELATAAQAQAWTAAHADGQTALLARSEAAIAYLVEQQGETGVGRLIHENATGSVAQFEALLHSITGMTVAELNATLNAWLQR